MRAAGPSTEGLRRLSPQHRAPETAATHHRSRWRRRTVARRRTSRPDARTT